MRVQGGRRGISDRAASFRVNFSAQVGISSHTGGWRLPESRRSSGFRRRFSGTPVALHFPVMTREQVQAVIGRVRPFLLADGGDIVIVGVHGHTADVRLTGMCAGCPSAHMTLHLGVEAALRDAIPEFETLRVV